LRRTGRGLCRRNCPGRPLLPFQDCRHSRRIHGDRQPSGHLPPLRNQYGGACPNRTHASGAGVTMATETILAIDQGTTNTKALLVNADGLVTASASRPMKQSYPHPAWVEMDGW